MLQLVREAGLHYVSSLAWGPDYSLPALLTEPFNYAEDGFPELWELPCHGWHDNLLKDNNRWGPRRLTLWPPIMPEAIPPGFLSTPEDEFAVNRVFLEKAAAENNVTASVARQGSLIWTVFQDQAPRSFDAIDGSKMEIYGRLHRGLIDRGIYLAPSGWEVGFVCAAHTDDDIDTTINAVADTFKSWS